MGIRMTVGKKIAFGLAAILILLVGVAVIAFVELDNAADGFLSYEEIAIDATLAGRVQANMLMARMEAENYLFMGTEKAREKYEERYKLMNLFLKQAHRDITKGERAPKIKQVDNAIREYNEAFQKVTDYMDRRNRNVKEVLDVKDPFMEKNLTGIMLSAKEENDMPAAFHAGVAMKHLLLGRLYMAKFLDTNDDQAVKRVTEEFGKLQRQLEILDRELENPQRRRLLAQVEEAGKIYTITFNDLVEVIFERNKLMKGTMAKAGPMVARYIEEVKLDIKEELDKMGPELRSSNNRSMIAILMVGMGAVILGTILSFFLTRGITRPLRSLTEAAGKIAGGDLKQKEFVIRSTDEVGVLARSLNTMLKAFQNVEAQANMIAGGDYDPANITVRSKADQLGKALVEMAKNLQKMNAENKKEDWLKTGMNELNIRMRGEQDLVELTRNIINFLADYLKVQVGVFYLVYEKDRFRLVSSYAYKMRNNNYTEFRLGEGLIGQAALERKSILFTNVPTEHIPLTINSGMGESFPHNILVLPLIFENSVLGVMAFGTSRKFNQNEIEFLDRVNESIAVNLNSAESNIHIRELLDQTQKQAEELQAQQEELRQTNEELQEQTEKLKASEEILQVQQEELKATNEELEEKAKLLESQKADIVRNNLSLEKSRAMLKQRAKDLELSTKYKSEFLANMSHELRTPLNSLMLLSKNLARNRDKNLTEKQVKDAEIIYNGGNELLTLINGILDLSKIEAGKVTVSPAEIFYSDLVRNITNSFEPSADEKGLAFGITVDQKLPDALYTDQQKLEQIIKNLVSNAIKFTEAGRIEIMFRKPDEDENLEKCGLNPEDAVAVSVSDTGIGIPKDKLRDIFEAFQQADGTTARRYGGTGLGLSITRQLAKLLGGEIKVESMEGKGSTFTVFIAEHLKKSKGDESQVEEEPVAYDLLEYTFETVPPAPSAGIEDDRTSLKKEDNVILVIEDDLNFAAILCDFCHEKNFKCLHAVDGETGLALIDTFPVSAVLLDIRLPGLNGWGVLKKLKGNFKTRHIPVHMMSVDSEPEDILKKGVIGYLTKPVSEKALDDAFARISGLISREVKKLLIVEDEPVVSEHLKEILSSGIIDIETVTKGEAAFEKIKNNRYDCMILDLLLPDISGFDLLKKFDLLDRARLPAIIIHTSKDLTEKEYVELNKYASSMITKGPFSSERLLDEVSLFLHTVVEELPQPAKREIDRMYAGDQVFKGKKIMIVDDDVRNIYAIISVLEGFDIEIIKAGNGEMALNMLKQHPDTDLIIMDIMMPVMDGYEAIRQIRKEARYEKLPIIALTAKVMEKDRDLCFKAGATDYLPKPVDTDKLLSAIRVWLH